MAFELITAHAHTTPTLIFDEVDVGISGIIGTKVGQTLKQLGKSAQIICVTHLAQVAAQGHNHLSIGKKQETTFTVIEHLSDEQRVDALAEMLGAVDRSGRAHAHAQSLLEESR